MQTALSRGKHAALCKRAAGVCAILVFGAGARPSRADPKVLDRIHTVALPEGQRFEVAHRFKVGAIIGGRKLSAIGLNFRQHFPALVEVNVPAVSFAVWSVRYTIGDAPIVKALEAVDRASVSHLAYIHRLMEMGGESGSHTDWRSNFSYVRSPVDRRLWAVHWSVNYVDEWTVGAVYVPHTDLDWPAGSRLFSPASLTPGSEEGLSNLPAGE
jgi:hypothetical protein